MADAYLQQYANILLEDATSILLAESGDKFVTDGSPPFVTDRFLMEDGAGVYLMEVAAAGGKPTEKGLFGGFYGPR